MKDNCRKMVDYIIIERLPINLSLEEVSQETPDAGTARSRPQILIASIFCCLT